MQRAAPTWHIPRLLASSAVLSLMAFDSGMSGLQSPVRIQFQFITELLAAGRTPAFEGAHVHEHAFAAFSGCYEAVAFGVLPLGESTVVAHRVFMGSESKR